MNCRRVESLIPLYVEDDLNRDEAASVSLHLGTCGDCSRLVSEYSESQVWLHRQAPPDFDEAELGDLKSRVLSQIERNASRSGLFRLLTDRWTSWQVFAATAAMIFLCAALAIYFYAPGAGGVLSPAPVTPEDATAEKSNPPQPPIENTEMAPGANSAPRPGSASLAAKRKPKVKAHSSGSRDKLLATRLEKRTHVATKEAQPDMKQNNEMLRIEIQTSDPNIRIIWFAPKETDASQSRPATD